MSDEPHGGGLTLGERIRGIESDVRATRDLIVELISRDRADLVRFDTLAQRLTETASQQQVTDLADRVAHLEASLTWAWRTVVGGIALAAIGLLIRLPTG